MSRGGVRGIARALAQPVTYLGVVLLVFIYCTLAYLLIVDRKNAEYDAGRRGDNLVRVVDQSFAHIFKSVDTSLLFLRKSYQQNPSTFDLAAWIADSSIRNELTFDFGIVDANGRIVGSSFSKDSIGADRSHREYFRAHANSTADELLISKPIILDFNGKWAIMLTRRITASDGTFAGVIAALLDPSELVKHIGTIDLGPNGSIALVGLDSYLRTRVVNGTIDWENIGRKVTLTPETLGRAFQINSGHYWSIPGVFNDIRRLVSYRVLESFPLISIVTIAEAEVYRRANENARVYWGIALLLTVAVVIAVSIGAVRERKLIETTSEMKHAQEELQRSEERYRLVADAVNDGLWDWNVLTGEAYLSPRWKSILGYADDEVPNLASSFFDRLHPDDKAAVAEAHRAHLEENKPYAADFRLRHKNGEYRWIHSRGKSLCDATNRPVRILGSITDITERKRAEALIEESHNNLERAERMALLGHHKIGKASNQLTWSEGVYRIFGKSSASFTPTLNVTPELIHPDDRPILMQYRRDAMAGLERPPITLRAIRDDGRAIYVENWLVPIRTSDGTVTGVFGTVQDITARKQAEAELQRSEERYRLVVDAVNDGLWDWDILTDHEYMSPRWKAILGFADDEVPSVKSAFFDLLHPDDKAAAIEATRAHLEERKPYTLDYRLRCKNGGYRWMHSRGTALYDAANRPVRMIGAITDITERKQAEEALALANQELEMRVAQRTAELANEMHGREKAQMTLAQTQKLNAVGQLTAGIAHDFNNLLAVIRGSLEFVTGEAARGLPAEPELIDAATRATRRGSELVQRLLAFSRQSPLKAEPTNLDQLVLDTLRLLQRTLGEEINIVTHLDATAAAVCVDRGLLANALVNLALNARDAMPEGGELTIVTTCRASQWAAKEGATRWPTGEEVCITITDTGTGMREEVRNRVFEPFFTTKKDGLGSGLGLSMVHGFVEQSGGHMEIESVVGNGTSITLHLPRVDMANQPADSDAVAGSSMAGKEKTVLLVEDDPDVRVVIAAQLKQLGYKVHAVANGSEAIDFIESPAEIDVTLTDVVLPGGIDGVTLVKNAMQARPTMGVLCMSGYDPTQKNRKWFRIQNIEFLEKPFSSSRLAQALDDTIEK